MLKSEFHIIFMCHKILFLFWFYFQPLKNETVLKLTGCPKAGGRLDSVCGCSFSNPGLHPEPWFLPTCRSPSSEQPRTQSSNAQCKSEKTRRHKELRLNSLVAGSVIIHFFYACACMCVYMVVQQSLFWTPEIHNAYQTSKKRCQLCNGLQTTGESWEYKV